VYLLESPSDLSHIDYTPSDDHRSEHADLQRAVAEARRELDDLIEDMGRQFGPEFSAVFHTHIQILEDKGFLSRIERRVEETVNAVEAVRDVVDEYKALFGRIEDPYFRERGVDVEDVGRRVVAKLLGVRHHNIPLSQGAVVVTDMILPAHFAMLETDKVGAIVAEHGGATSHGAIFARTLEIPAVTGVRDVFELARPGELAIVDGTKGRVYLSPDERLLEEYREARQQFQIMVGHLDALRERPSETRDGRPIRLTANVGLLADLELCERHGVEGVGLFRTELLALAHRGIPKEEEQRKVYAQAAAAMAPHPVTIRTLDLGGDKPMPGIGFENEENPQLGCRSIRLSLRDEESLRVQLRAILRANEAGNIRCLLPMISSLDELRRVKTILGEIVEEVERESAAPTLALPLGVMIEVPSAALIADALAAECDFFSIGTNDLTQYTLAVDRGNEAISHLYRQLHPAVLKLIHKSARAAAQAGIPVSVCGEMASMALAAPLLVGMGIGELSGSPRAVPIVKEIIRAVDSADLESDARAALAAGTFGEVELIAADRLEAAGLLEHPDLSPWLNDIVTRVRERSR
jgi:phosphoenolpyruvate-protein phosphotransferase